MRRPVDAPGRLAARLLATAATAALISGAAAGAARAEPKIMQPPQIGGSFWVGGAMSATAVWDSGSPVWTWLRCESDQLRSCSEIRGAQEQTYVATPEDGGEQLRVLLRLRDDDRKGPGGHGRRAAAVSEPTPPIGAAPPPPPPVPLAAPTPAPTAAPSPPPPPQQLLSPFPVVRVRGYVAPGGARLSLLTVQAPEGARVSVTCSGDRCPRRRFATTAGVVRLRPFERTLRAGTRLEIRVEQAPFVGKYTLLVMRRDRPPTRTDRCLMPGSSLPAACPA